MSLFQSNLRKQIRKLPKILKSVKIIQYYSISFIRVLSRARARAASPAPRAGSARAAPGTGSRCGASPASRRGRPHVQNVLPAASSIGQTLQGSFSAVSKPIFATKYSLESSRRDLHNTLLCTALQSQFFHQKVYLIFDKI